MLVLIAHCTNMNIVVISSIFYVFLNISITATNRHYIPQTSRNKEMYHTLQGCLKRLKTLLLQITRSKVFPYSLFY